MTFRALLILAFATACGDADTTPDGGAALDSAVFDVNTNDAPPLDAVDRNDAGSEDGGSHDAGNHDAGNQDAGEGTDAGPGAPVALSLDSTNTGVRGGVAAGECAGDPSAPFDGLDTYEGRVLIDDAFVRDELGGERIFENFDIRGNLVIEADDITIRCGRVAGGSNYTIQNTAASGLIVEWVEASQRDTGKVLLGGNFEMRRADIHGGEDGLHINRGRSIIEETYVHDQNKRSGSHADCIQLTSGGRVEEVIIRRSKLINFYQTSNAPLQVNVVDRWSIEESYLWGGVYMINGDPGMPGEVHDCYFAWDSSQFGTIGGVSVAERSGNVWWEWLNPRCGDGVDSAPSCETPGDHPGNGSPL